MSREVHVHLLPDHVPARDLRGGIAVVVDILRASTTMLTALNHGAFSIQPCLSVEQAFDCRRQDPLVLLGGERGGVRIEGFDLSNSPADYGRSTVSSRRIAFTTTNGTRALHHSTQANQIVIGAFANVNRLAAALAANQLPVHVVCAGTNGEVTGEDVLFAGCLIDCLQQLSGAVAWELTDTAWMAWGWWQRESSQRALAESLRATRGGRNLVALSYGADIETAAQLDTHPVLAVYDHGTQLITPQR